MKNGFSTLFFIISSKENFQLYEAAEYAKSNCPQGMFPIEALKTDAPQNRHFLYGHL